MKTTNFIFEWHPNFEPYFTAHAQKGQNTTSGIRSDHAIRSGMVENLYIHEIVAENAILGAL